MIRDGEGVDTRTKLLNETRAIPPGGLMSVYGAISVLKHCSFVASFLEDLERGVRWRKRRDGTCRIGCPVFQKSLRRDFRR